MGSMGVADSGNVRRADVIQFAKSRGWSCREPVSYSEEQLRVWQLAGEPVFSLQFGPGDPQPENHSTKKFPRHITSDSLVYECKTGWIRVEPGTGKETDALGYIQIEQSGTRLAVYHLWGET